MENLTAYQRIAQKIEEQEPHTAPKAEDGSIHPAFIEYLELVYTPEEAELVQHLNVLEAFSSSQQVADAAGRSREDVEKTLTEVSSKNAIMGFGDAYCLPAIPLLVNIHQFYPEVKPDDAEAAELYRQYFIEGRFYKYYEASKKGTPMARIIPINRAIEASQKVLEAEEAHDFIMNHCAEELALVPCPCRTRTEKMGSRECKDEFPVGACIMMGGAALHFEERGLGKRITKQQAVEFFDEMVDVGLVGQAINAEFGDVVMCFCCGCCCSQVRGRTRWDNPDALSPANFLPEAGEDCTLCGTCVDRCLLGAISIDEDADEKRVDKDKCIGCGVCTLTCPQETLKLHRYERSTPFETSKKLFDTVGRENREA